MTETAAIYGRSLYQLAAEENLTEQIWKQMEEIHEVFLENPEYLRILEEPSIPEEERIGLLEAAFGGRTERYLVNFLKLLCERSMLRDYEECCREFTRRYYAEYGIAEAVVRSAAGLTEKQQEALKTKLEQLSGKKISLILREDPTVLAGLRVEMEGRVLDGTLQSRVAGISRILTADCENSLRS